MNNPGLSSVDVYKLRTEYGIEALKKIGKVDELMNENTGLIDVYFNGIVYMSFCPSGPSMDSFWIDSETEVDEVKYNMIYINNTDGSRTKNISKLN